MKTTATRRGAGLGLAACLGLPVPACADVTIWACGSAAALEKRPADHRRGRRACPARDRAFGGDPLGVDAGWRPGLPDDRRRPAWQDRSLVCQDGFPRVDHRHAAAMRHRLSARCTLDIGRMTLPGRAGVPLFAITPPLIPMNRDAAFAAPILRTGALSGDLGAVDCGALQASVIAKTLASLAVCLLLQKYCVSGMMAGAVK